mgnify:CR=1 FL=1
MEAIFKGSGEMRFSLGDVQARVAGDTAWVTCAENILSELRGNIAVTALVATNVFERQSGEWRMVLHHASHVLTRGAARRPRGGLAAQGLHHVLVGRRPGASLGR